MNINYIRKKSIKTINSEMVKFTDIDQKIVYKFCLETSLYKKLHTLFTESELLNVTKEVFENSLIRDFMLDLTDKLSIELGLGQAGQYEIEDYIASTLSYYPSAQVVKQENILMPLKVLDNIGVIKEEIFSSLLNNKWLVTIVLINLYFFDTEFFDGKKPDSLVFLK